MNHHECVWLIDEVIHVCWSRINATNEGEMNIKDIRILARLLQMLISRVHYEIKKN